MNGIKDPLINQSSAPVVKARTGISQEEKRRISRHNYRENNREKLRLAQREYALKNPEKISEYRKQYAEDNEEKFKKYKKDWYLKNRDKILAKRKEDHKKNPSILKERTKRFREQPRIFAKDDQEKTKQCRTCKEIKKIPEFPRNNGYASGISNECIICTKGRSKLIRENYKVKRSERRKILRRTDIKYNISNRIRTSIWQTLKKNKIQKTCNTFNILGYTPEILIKRLKKTLVILNKRTGIKYTWDHFLRGELHIDHIIPISKFNYKTIDDDDFKRCWSIDNLQLLPAIENLIKSDKCDNFQISMFSFINQKNLK